MTIEDNQGGDITTATISHFVGSTSPEFLFTSTDFNSYIDIHLADDAPMRKERHLRVPSDPGLSIHVDQKMLGKPILILK